MHRLSHDFIVLIIFYRIKHDAIVTSIVESRVRSGLSRYVISFLHEIDVKFYAM